jgi:glycosyltransferase involved in cell wall biosynthesis
VRRNESTVRARVAVDRLSVIVPCRNEAVGLPHQLAALATQDFDGWSEVIVVDDGSTDGTRAVCTSFGTRIDNLRVIDAPGPPGRQRASNAGARAARGDAFLFVDGDDEVAPGYLAAMAAALAVHDLVAARVDYDALKPAWVGARHSPQGNGLQDWGFLPTAGGGTLGVRRDLFERIGGFDEEMTAAEDVDFCWRAQLAGSDLHFVPDASLRLRYREGMRGVFGQALHQGFGISLLRRRFGRPTLREKISGGRNESSQGRSAGRLVRHFRVWDRDERARLVWDVGYLAGWARGALARSGARRTSEPARPVQG